MCMSLVSSRCITEDIIISQFIFAEDCNVKLSGGAVNVELKICIEEWTTPTLCKINTCK